MTFSIVKCFAMLSIPLLTFMPGMTFPIISETNCSPSRFSAGADLIFDREITLRELERLLALPARGSEPVLHILAGLLRFLREHVGGIRLCNAHERDALAANLLLPKEPSRLNDIFCPSSAAHGQR